MPVSEVPVTDQSRRRAAAPIDYTEMRTVYQTVRLLMAVILGTLGVVGVVRDGGLPLTAVAGAIVGVDALVRRTRGMSPLPSIALDIIALNTVLLLRGTAPYSQAASTSFIIVAAVLMLPTLRAVVLTAAATLYGVAIVLWSPLLASEPTIVSTPLLDQAGMIVFLLGTVALLFTAAQTLRTMRVQHAEALETERKAAALKDEFVSMVSHELRTPLTSIAGFTDTLRESWERLGRAEIEEFLQIMSQESTHLSNLVEDILVIPRLEAGRLRLDPTDVELREAAYSVVDVVITSDTPKEAFVAIPGGVIVKVDPVRIRQVLRNLLDNARKYGGDQILIEGGASGNQYHVVVSDNGQGVAEEDRDRIFEHFEQGSKGDARTDSGVGLGLPIARRLVRAMGGELWYEARFPTGARFCFTLPLVAIQGHVPERGGVSDRAPEVPR